MTCYNIKTAAYMLMTTGNKREDGRTNCDIRGKFDKSKKNLSLGSAVKFKILSSVSSNIENIADL